MHTLQPAQTSDPAAPYDPKLPLPYPFHIEDDGSVARQDFWRGDPAKLVGFQRGNVQRVVLTVEDWIAGDADAAVGLKPVFVDSDGDLWNDDRPVQTVTVSE